MKKAKYHFYTLTELLVVVAIAAILLGITLPAFNVLIKGNAMTSATNELAAKIKATRAYAITNNCYTALVFPTYIDDPAYKDNFPEKRKHFFYRSYRPCILNKVPNTDGTTFNFEFDSWIEEENWTLIPPGIILSKDHSDCIGNSDLPSGYTVANLTFKPITGKVPQTLSELNSLTLGTPNELKDIKADLLGLLEPDATNEEKGKLVKFDRVMIFRPDGQLEQSIIFLLQEGTVSTDGTPTATQAAGQRVYYPIFINKRSGKITYFEPLSKDTTN